MKFSPLLLGTALVQFQECSDKSSKNIFNSDIVASRSYTLFVVDSAVGKVTTDDREIRVIFSPVTQCFPFCKASRQPLGLNQMFFRPGHDADHASPSSGLHFPFAFME